MKAILFGILATLALVGFNTLTAHGATPQPSEEMKAEVAAQLNAWYAECAEPYCQQATGYTNGK